MPGSATQTSDDTHAAAAGSAGGQPDQAGSIIGEVARAELELAGQELIRTAERVDGAKSIRRFPCLVEKVYVKVGDDRQERRSVG